jgi:hypothetical protein
MTEEIEVFQFKFNNGDEVMTEVACWDHDGYLVFLTPLVMLPIMNMDEPMGSSTFIFKPWLEYQDQFDAQVTVNPNSIVSYFIPSESLRKGYVESVKEIQEMFAQTNQEVQRDKTTINSAKVVSIFGDKEP